MGLENPIHFARGQSLNEERGRLIATVIGQQALGPISYYGRFQWSLFCDFCEISRHVYALNDTCGVLYCLRFFHQFVSFDGYFFINITSSVQIHAFLVSTFK